MNDRYYERLAESIRALSPEAPMSAAEIGAAVKAQGLERFIQSAGSGTAGLAEIAELLARMGKGGTAYGSGQAI